MKIEYEKIKNEIMNELKYDIIKTIFKFETNVEFFEE